MATDQAGTLTFEDIATLKDAAYTDQFDPRLHQRNDALITLLYDTGLPVTTLLDLDVDDVTPDRSHLSIPATVDATTIPSDRLDTPTADGAAVHTDRQQLTLDPTGYIGTRRLLNAYLQHRWKDTDALFPSQKADRLTVRGVRHLVSTIADEAATNAQASTREPIDPETVTPARIRQTPPPTPTNHQTTTPDSPIAGRHPAEHPVLDALPDLFYVVDTNGQFRRWNERLTDVTGYSDDALTEIHAIELIAPPEREMIGDAMTSVFDGNTETRETQLQTQDGEQIPYEFNGAPVTNASGDIVALAGIGRDLSERRRRERELQRYKTIVDTVGDGVYQLDAVGNVVMVNDAATSVTGYDREEVVGNHVAKLLSDEDLTAFVNLIQELLADDDRTVGELEFDVQTADGDTIPAHARLAVLETDGEFQGTVGVVRDISKRRDRMQALQRQRDQLETLDRINAVIRRIDRSLVQATTEAEIKQSVCKELADIEQYRFAWFGEYDTTTDRIHPQAWAGVEEGYLDHRPDPSSETITAETAYHTGTIQVAQRIADNDDYAGWRDAALDRGYRSAVAIPLTYREVTYGVLCLYAPRPEAFNDRECAVLSELGTTIANAISAMRRRELLMSDAVIELEFVVRDSAFPLADIAAETGATLELQGMVATQDGAPTVFVTATDATPETVIDAATDRVTAPTTISTDDDEVLFRFNTNTTALLPYEIAEYGGSIHETIATDGDIRVTAAFPQTIEVRTVLSALREEGYEIDLLARRDRQRPTRTVAEFRSDLDERLTDRQHETLKTAYLSGFFDQPRTATGEEVATTLDIATPTLHEHIRAGERKLLDTYFEDTRR